VKIPYLLMLCAAPLAAQTADLSAGIAHYNARRWAEAHAVFANVTKAQPKNADAALWYGKTLLAEDRAGDAEDWFEKVTKLSPQNSEAHLWLARSVGAQALRANALKQPFLARRLKHAVDHAIELDPDNVDARELRWQYYAMAPSVMGGGEEKARAEAAEIMKRNRYRGQMLSAGAASRARDYATAERLLKSVVSEHPDSVSAVGSFAVFLADRGRPAEAFAAVEAYQKRHPADPVVHYQLGRVAAVTGQQLDRGEAALRKYLAVAPTPGPNVPAPSAAYLRLGNIAERRGDTAAARAAYEQALRLEPRSAPARRALAALK
jgi:tetratricopeptide (TPR) repeat protein